MKIRPISINENLCCEFEGASIDDISVMVGGYIITPRGEMILVRDQDEHHIVFSKYINEYFEKSDGDIYNTFEATKRLCDLGCVVYAGVRLEYAKNKLGSLDNTMASLTLPNINDITDIQKKICLKLIDSNKSIFGNREKIDIQYGSFPDNVYTKEEIVEILQPGYKNIDNKLF